MTKEWIPSSWENFVLELSNITAIDQQKHLLLFRGHRHREWLLDSAFVRSIKAILFELVSEGFSERVLGSVEFRSALLNLFSLKFSVLQTPSKELQDAEEAHGVDQWFEHMKRIQQYPEKTDGPFLLKGTNLMDWTKSSDIALYFANLGRSGEGAIFICDTIAAGNILLSISVREILDKMIVAEKPVHERTLPFLFSPQKQISYARAKNQQAVYFAQMDLRYDLGRFWRLQEEQRTEETILIKLILPADTEAEAQQHLQERGITNDFIYPSEREEFT